MKDLESIVIAYRQGEDIEGAKEFEIIDNSQKDNKNQPKQVVIDLEETIDRSLASSQTSLLEEIEMQKLEVKIIQNQPFGISSSSK